LNETTGNGNEAAQKRSRLSQEDVPSYSLEQALRVPRAIAENYAYAPTRPLNIAGAMRMTPSSGPFRMLTGAAVAYGLTTGASKSPEIGLTPLGMRIVRPTQEGDDLAAKRDALLRPKVIGEFLRRYDGSPIPPANIAENVLQEMNVPTDRVEDVLALIVDGANSLGFLKEIGGKRYVDLSGTSTQSSTKPAPEAATVDIKPVEKTFLPTLSPTPASGVSISPGVHINIEIHIAADASAGTVEEIFKNMRRYVLTADDSAEG
jgi:hypothetical protein